MVSSSNTRKSGRTRILTSKAKQYQLDSKPVLRSISIIDEDENIYNSLSFKKRRMNPVEEQPEASEEEQVQNASVDSFEYNSNIDNDEDDNESVASEDEESILNQMSSVTKFEDDGSEFSSQSDDDIDTEDMFNSDEDNEYYSAISDYENDTKPKFNDATQSTVVEVSHSKFLNSNNLFKETSSIPNCELRSLEENFQKIINEHQDRSKSSVPSIPVSSAFPSFTDSAPLSIDDFVEYSDDLIDDSEPSSPITSSTLRSSKFLQYRHDEKHNLAFPDVSTFPIRFDPSMAAQSIGSKGMKMRTGGKRIRALNRRAILSGKASEMVGTGISNFGEFTF